MWLPRDLEALPARMGPSGTSRWPATFLRAGTLLILKTSMNNDQLFNLYEKMYFHEIENREKLLTRLQIPLALLLAMASVISYLIKGIELKAFSAWSWVFIVTLLSCFWLYAVSVWSFARGYFGYTYEFIPTAIETEEYRLKLIDTYKGYDNQGELVSRYFNDYLHKYYAECATANAKINDTKSYYIHKCNKNIAALVIPIVAAFLILTLTGIDQRDKKPEALKVTITEPIVIESGDISHPTFTESEAMLTNERQAKGSTEATTATSKATD